LIGGARGRGIRGGVRLGERRFLYCLLLSGELAGDDAGGRLGAAAGGAVVPEAGGGLPWLERVVWLVPLPEELLAEGELSQAASERASTVAAISHFPFIGRLRSVHVSRDMGRRLERPTFGQQRRRAKKSRRPIFLSRAASTMCFMSRSSRVSPFSRRARRWRTHNKKGSAGLPFDSQSPAGVSPAAECALRCCARCWRNISCSKLCPVQYNDGPRAALWTEEVEEPPVVTHASWEWFDPGHSLRAQKSNRISILEVPITVEENLRVKR
jgi:hypothetical protein